MSDKINSEGYEKRINYGPADAARPAIDLGGLRSAAVNPYADLGKIKASPPKSVLDNLKDERASRQTAFDHHSELAKRAEQAIADLDVAIAALSPMPEAGEGARYRVFVEDATTGEGIQLDFTDRELAIGYAQRMVDSGTVTRVHAMNADGFSIFLWEVPLPQPATPEQGLGEIENTEGLLDHEQGSQDEPSSQESSTDAAGEASSNPYEEGRAACAQGAELWQNPYPTTHDNPLLDPGPSQEFAQWEDGFLDADLEASSGAGERLIESARQAAAIARGDDQPASVFIPDTPDSSDAQVFAHGIPKDAQRKASEPKHSVIGRLFGGTKSFAKPEGAL